MCGAERKIEPSDSKKTVSIWTTASRVLAVARVVSTTRVVRTCAKIVCGGNPRNKLIYIFLGFSDAILFELYFTSIS